MKTIITDIERKHFNFYDFIENIQLTGLFFDDFELETMVEHIIDNYYTWDKPDEYIIENVETYLSSKGKTLKQYCFDLAYKNLTKYPFSFNFISLNPSCDLTTYNCRYKDLANRNTYRNFLLSILNNNDYKIFTLLKKAVEYNLLNQWDLDRYLALGDNLPALLTKIKTISETELDLIDLVIDEIDHDATYIEQDNIKYQYDIDYYGAIRIDYDSMYYQFMKGGDVYDS